MQLDPQCDLTTEIFAKRFQYSIPPHGDEDKSWKLPSRIEGSEVCDFDNAVLKQLKKELNEVKCSLNDYDIASWHKHTGRTNPAGGVIFNIRQRFHPELCTQAWCKFHEILCSEDIIPKHALSTRRLNSVHICEAPGAFISSLNHFLKSRFHKVKYQWLATTLNPYYEGNDPDCCVTDDRLIFQTLDSWCFGSQQTGNVFCENVFEEVKSRAAELKVVHLVTADGSINCQENPERQEEDTSSLKYTEVCYAINILGHGGSLVLKSFTMFEYNSICLMYMLCCMFEKVTVQKPATSKPGNSEVYVVATNFHDYISPAHIPEDFIEQHVECVKYFVSLQISTIRRNKLLFESDWADLQLKFQQQQVSDAAIEWMQMRKIPKNQGIVKSGILQGKVSSNIKLRPMLTGSYSERHSKHNGTVQDGYVGNIKSHAQKRIVLSWHTAKIFNCDNPTYVIGKVPSSVKISLFCETEKLVIYRDLNRTSPSRAWPEHLIIDHEVALVLNQIAKDIGELEVCKIDLNQDFTQNWGKTTAANEACPFGDLRMANIADKRVLSRCGLLLACVSNATGDELHCLKDLLEVVTFAMNYSAISSSFICFLPSILLRITAGLIWILLQGFEKHTFLPNIDLNSTPGVFLVCSGRNNNISWNQYLTELGKVSNELAENQCVLEILSIPILLKDHHYVASLKTVNAQVLAHMCKVMGQCQIDESKQESVLHK